jgi:hypothetical protein
MKRTIKKTVTVIKCFDKKENKVDERKFSIQRINERKIAKEIDKIAADNNLVVIDIISQDIIKETYEMDDATFFANAKLVK